MLKIFNSNYSIIYSSVYLHKKENAFFFSDKENVLVQHK